MKVFYVMVLVLVAGAVPSHGRTESEGAVFNKTQPHESMNNVPVSSSKLVPYNRLYLVMQWSTTCCNLYKRNSGQCSQRFGRFTVHGLWPQSSNGDINCTDIRRNGRHALFDWPRLQQYPRLLHDLGFYWPDLKNDNNPYFWGTEYNKHGSCTFNNQIQFFQHTLRLVVDFERLNLISRLQGYRIIPGGSYWPKDISVAVYSLTGKKAMLRCGRVGNEMQLQEIRFCAGRNQLRSCNRYSWNCGNQKVVWPR